MNHCPFCTRSFTGPEGLEAHLENFHSEQLGGLTPAHYLFNVRNGKSGGLCTMRNRVPGCLKTAAFNERSRRYERFCSHPGCREAYVAEFRKRMLEKYGKLNLLDEPSQQRLMLTRRSISGRYAFRTGEQFEYVGRAEHEFLEYLDQVLEWPAADLLTPAPVDIPYTFEGKQSIYIPDLAIPSIELLIEIKDTNAHYEARERARLAVKEAAAASFRGQGTGRWKNFLEIRDRNYDEFLAGLLEGRWAPAPAGRLLTESSDPRAVLREAALCEEAGADLD